MAHLREYDYQEENNVLVMYFYWDSHDSEPALVIRLNTLALLDIHIYKHRYVVSRLCIVQELERLLLLLEEPHWKSYVSLTASRHYRERNYELF